MAASSLPLHLEALRNPLAGSSNRRLHSRSIFHLISPRRTASTVMTPSAKFNLSEMMGGRGICNGEQGLAKELHRPG
ncbi:hypothetical protein KSP40_PGU010120 [Platanthera guangdongensis]|uniref:Uncharacterized protein n=1 Tax=Platanthera guangdongensis TaxID=2320717 RepID=A0ABR2MPB4_9ASPA